MNELNSVVGPGPHELRAQADHIEATHPGTAQLLHEAADEIERLRARLIEITMYRLGSESQLELADLRAIAQEALDGR